MNEQKLRREAWQSIQVSVYACLPCWKESSATLEAESCTEVTTPLCAAYHERERAPDLSPLSRPEAYDTEP